MDRKQQVSPLGTILMDQARDLAYAQRDSKPLDSIVSEGAARIAAHYQPKPCAMCRECEGGYRLSPYCVSCYRDRFAEQRDDGSDE